MGERINRQDDENLYQPKIHSIRIRSLYLIVEGTNLPMTVLVDLAIKEFVEKYEVDFGKFQDLNGSDQFETGDGGEL